VINILLVESGVAIVISDIVDFKLTLVKRDKEGHCILIKRTVHQKEIVRNTKMATKVQNQKA
jgi:hypothetical protein